MKSISLKTSRWFFPLLGAFLGFLYVIVDEGILDEMSGAPGLVPVLHEFVDAILPVLCGVAVGIGIYFLKRQRRVNDRLSLKNDRLQRDLLFNTLISQVLHEIRNPLHNIAAVLEDCDDRLQPDSRLMIKRNLEKIDTLKKQYGQWSSVLDQVDPHEVTVFSPWLENFIEEKIQPQLKAMSVNFHQRVQPITALIHPVFLEQALMTLFSNAFEAFERSTVSQRPLLELTAGAATGVPGYIEIRVTNDVCFPEEVLASQGRKPVRSRHGMGLGLLLLRNLLDQVGGRLELMNERGCATVTILLKGFPL
jgi:signal transduction histidine kinase